MHIDVVSKKTVGKVSLKIKKIKKKPLDMPPCTVG